MEDRGVGEAIAVLLAVDVSGCDRAGLGGVVKLAQRVRGWVDAVDVAIARRSRQLAAEGRSESATEVLTGYGRRSTRETKAASDRSEVCEQMPGFETALASGDVSSSHVDAIANASKGLDDAGRERLGELQDALLGFARIEPVSVFERRCRLLGKRLAGDEGESELDRQKAAVSVRRWVDKASGMHHTHLALDPERDAKLWSAIDAQLASIKQADGNAGTPIDICSPTPSWPRCLGSGQGIGGCLRSACTSTTTPCSTACTSARCVRPPTGSRCHPKRCAVSPVRRRSCRSCSTAPAKP